MRTKKEIYWSGIATLIVGFIIATFFTVFASGALSILGIRVLGVVLMIAGIALVIYGDLSKPSLSTHAYKYSVEKEVG